MKEHLITFVVMDGIQPLDLFGPLEAFAAAKEIAGSPYRWQIAASSHKSISVESGARILPDIIFEEVGVTDTVVFVGGFGPRTVKLPSADLEQLDRICSSASRLTSVCTGTFLMANLGLPIGTEVTTHWRYTDDFQRAFPNLNVNAEALFVQDKHIWTSAGITAGIDMALAIIAEDCGSAVSTSVARQLVVYLRRPGNQVQFSEPLMAQSGSAGRFSDVLTWVADNLKGSISVETMAKLAGMSTRHFARLFREETGKTPAQYVENMRLDYARTLLGEGDGQIHQIALSSGYNNPDSFRRAFERRFALSPTIYREQFSTMEPRL